LLVRNISEFRDTKKSVNISWEVPEVVNGIIERYKISIIENSKLPRDFSTEKTFEIVGDLGKLKFSSLLLIKYIFSLMSRLTL